ncbi:RES family NAD+ phosphorylase [Thioclava sp.]|uniref:RES family NAD+ phosphorylase n=1 Tax=Thioclava sp. TaxID=1933450 RepID=UPI003AA86C9D
MIPFRGPAWRILSAKHAQNALKPAHHPEGRFHYDAQLALYASLSADGAGVALRRYVRANDPPRVIVPLTIDLERVMDARGDARHSVVWQDARAQGLPAPTWEISDAARRLGAQALLYSSRSRPDLSHLVMFDVTPHTVTQTGPAQDWHPQYNIQP